MEERTIVNPKVFISYAWNTEDYQNKVLKFASDLVIDGVDVIIDKWSLSPGNDTITFMEKCVNDSDVNFVLMLLDKTYKDKANTKSGGVGKETQIISSEVYSNVNQEKFIPIIFEKGRDGSLFIPTYLVSRLHIDLDCENRSLEYQKLVRIIYGVKNYEKPTLGTMPLWVTELKVSKRSKYAIIENKIHNKVSNENQQKKFRDLISEIKNIFKTEMESIKFVEQTKILEQVDDTLEFRNLVIDLFEENFHLDIFNTEVSDFIEYMYNTKMHLNTTYSKSIGSFLLFEIVIYLLSMLFKNKEYSKLYDFVSKTYFISEYGITKSSSLSGFAQPTKFTLILDRILSELDKKTYLSGTAELIVRRVYLPKYSRDDLIFIDELFFNLDILCSIYTDRAWFPLLYVYGYNYQNMIRDFSIRLKSKQQINRFLYLFGVKSFDEFLKLINENDIKDIKLNVYKYRYQNSFETPNFLFNFINVEELGMLP